MEQVKTEVPELSIIIVNYNGERFLVECLQSIRQLVSCAHEVIIVDNNSADSSVDLIKREFPEVVLIESKENTGFTGGNNLGAAAAKGELLLLLNNDTRLLTDVQPIVGAFSRSERLGIAGCRMEYGDGRLQCSMGYDHTPLRVLLSWLGLKRLTWLPSVFRREILSEDCYSSKQDDVAWVSGAFLMIRRSMYEQVGGLNDEYFMYMEDVELCKMVRMRGAVVSFFPDVRIVHYEGSGKAWIGEQALKRTLRSYLIFTCKFYGTAPARRLKQAMSVVMRFRSLIYGVLGMAGGGAIAEEKRLGYRAAGEYLRGLEIPPQGKS